MDTRLTPRIRFLTLLFSVATLGVTACDYGPVYPVGFRRQPGTLEGGNLGTMPYNERLKTWDPGTSTTAHQVLHLNAQNLAQVVVHPARARLSCNAHLDVTTDGPLTLRLAGCGRTLTFGGS